MQLGKAARQDNIRTWLTLAPGLRIWIVEAHQTGILIELHPQSYGHAVTVTITLGDLEINGCDVMPAVRIRTGGDEGLNLSCTARSGAGIVDTAVGRIKRIGSAIPVPGQWNVAGLA